MKYAKTFRLADEAEELCELRNAAGQSTAIEHHEDGGATLYSSAPFRSLVPA